MKKKKIQYSMTAKERKEQRRAIEEKKNKGKGNAVTTNSVAQTVDNGAAAVAVQSKQKMWIPITCIVLALVIICVAVILLVIKPTRTSRYPHAIITLTDGRRLNLTIWEEDTPIAATNFIFLCKIGFFDGNLIYDVQKSNNYMRFGAYTDYNAEKTKYKDKNFVDGISRKIFNILDVDAAHKNNAASNKFGYRLRTDKREQGGYASRFTQKYAVSFNSNDSGDFVINMGENNTRFYDSSGTTSLNNMLSAFGAFEDAESQKILEELMKGETVSNTGLGNGVIGFKDPVRIRKIEIINEDEDKWDNFEFVSYMKKAYDGSSAFRTWYGA